MSAQKSSLRVISILLAFFAWGVFYPSITTGSVSPETADFEDVAVGSTGSIPLEIENTGSSTLILNLRFENYSCNFFLSQQSDISLNPGESVTVNISWTPAEGSVGTACSDTLKILNGYTELLETVPVTAKAVAAGDPRTDPNSTIVIGEHDTGVVDRLYDEKLISEWIGACVAGAKNRCRFVRCVSALTNELKKAGIISCQDKRAIQRCAAQVKVRQRPRSKVPRSGLTKRRAHHHRWFRGFCR